MKSLLLTLAIVLLLAQLVSGSMYVKKCADRRGNCRIKCRTGEMQLELPTSMCSKRKMCCILSAKALSPLLCVDDLKTASVAGKVETLELVTTVRMP